MRRTIGWAISALVLGAFVAASPLRAVAEPAMPGFEITTYANLTGPESLVFDAAGNLYCGQGIPGGNGGESVPIPRIAPGGSSVTAYGPAIPDPDGVLVDADGSISGISGALLVCGDPGNGQGQIVAIRPDQTLATVSAASPVMENPNFMARGRDGVLITDSSTQKVYVFTPPGPPTIFINSPSVPLHIVVDPTNRVFVSHGDGTVRIWDADGNVVDAAFGTGLGNGPPIALARGGDFGTDLYALHQETGELVRIAPDRTATVVGTGFPSSAGGMTFGPDGALYVADFQNGAVLRVAPKAIEAFFLPKKVKAKVNTSDASRSTLVATGSFDTGPEAPDFASTTTLDVGGVHVTSNALTQKGRSFGFVQDGVTFSITPNPYGSSRAKFKLKYVGDLGGKVGLDEPLELHFTDAVITDARGTVNLQGGAFTGGKVRGALVDPNLFVVRAHAILKGPGKDVLVVIVGLATDGATPAEASDLSLAFGDRFGATIPAAQFVRDGDTDAYTGATGGVTKAVVDYAREQITITGKGLSLGDFDQGANAIRINVGLGSDARGVSVRMGRKGALMKY